MKRLCKTCKFWEEKPPDRMGHLQPGKCRRNAPVREAQVSRGAGLWPLTGPGDWCGQWRKVEQAEEAC